MALSTSTVFVIVQDDLKPDLIGTLADADGQVVPRAGKTVHVAVRPVGGGTQTFITATWADDPTNTRPKVTWTTGNKLALGSYYARFLTDKDGSEQWSFPTEEFFTIVVTAK